MKRQYLDQVRNGKTLTKKEQITMIWQLSFPAILAQLSSILMQYIDAAMVGRLGADDSASIGLVSTTTWLIGGLCSAAGTGFTVQIAHKIGAKKEEEARSVMKHGLFAVFLFALFFSLVGIGISRYLPGWMGANKEIWRSATIYFLIYSISLPALQIVYAAGGMIQCSGNMKFPSIVDIMMCVLDVIFNFFLIFPSRRVEFLGTSLWVPGANLRVAGAALGTALAEITCGSLLLFYLLFYSPALHLRKGDRKFSKKAELIRAARISLPACIESVIMGLSYVAFTRIVAPLGKIPLAAHSFSITAESVCYMPGYGIGAAATTIVGQTCGAKRKKLANQMGMFATFLGMGIMTLMGMFLFIFAPFMIGLLSPDPGIRELGTMVLRIEAFAEPMYAASIVISGVFRGQGKTLLSSILNLVSVWLVRIPVAAILAGRLGLKGVWIAMCLELIVRGSLFLLAFAMERKKEEKLFFLPVHDKMTGDER